MKIDTLVVGSLATNCYIVSKNNKCLIIDPGDEANKIIDACKDKEVVGILITHYHFDHIGALDEVKNYFNVEVNPKNIDGFNYEIIETPGHKEDCLTFYFEKEHVMFVGDFIFNDSIGRMDLAGGNVKDMRDSLKLIKSYPDDTILYPGHGPTTILGKEKRHFIYYI
ncbi:MAG: MBL fold metallo-hydrolase [Bacilli bacterium]|nr:MBL fold metallo-hydrolase [Bacilli bacterium]